MWGNFSWLVVLVLCSVVGQAGAQVTEGEREALIDLYHATGGDDWDENDGWLGPAGSECEWLGIVCRADDAGNLRVFRVRLADNGLSGGGLPASLPQLTHLVELDLSHNLLEGSLPVEVDGVVVLRILNLAGNRYDHWPENLVWPPNITQLDLSRNQLTGPIPDSVLTAETLFSNTQISLFGGLDLCWNDVHAADEVIESFVRQRHRGIHFELCQGREFADLDRHFSGSLYDPQRSGEGISLMQLDSGDLLVFSFTYDRDGRQRWRFGVAGVEGAQAVFDPFYESRGRFGFGYDPDEVDGGPVARGQLEIDALSDQRLAILQASVEPLLIPLTGLARIGLRLEYQPLTRLAGTGCDNQSALQHYSGAWYDPERNGEGFIVEVLSDDRALVYWFTYTPDGDGQAWMMGDGSISKTDPPIFGLLPPPSMETARIEVDHLVQPTGAVFGPDFDPDDVDRQPWGQLTISFSDDGNGHVAWDSELDEYGSGEHPIEPLARPMLAECE